MANIRTASTEDLGTILDLNQRLFEREIERFDSTLSGTWTGTEEARNYFLGRIQGNDGCAFVAEQDGSIVGYLVAGLEKAGLYRGNLTIAELENMFVDDSSRSLGIGAQLYEEFESWARGKGADRVKVVASAGNQRAIEFYKRCGFQDYDVTLESDL